MSYFLIWGCIFFIDILWLGAVKNKGFPFVKNCLKFEKVQAFTMQLLLFRNPSHPSLSPLWEIQTEICSLLLEKMGWSKLSLNDILS